MANLVLPYSVTGRQLELSFVKQAIKLGEIKLASYLAVAGCGYRFGNLSLKSNCDETFPENHSDYHLYRIIAAM